MLSARKLQSRPAKGRREGLVVVEEAPDDVAAVIAELEDEMAEAAAHLEFEKAAVIRDQIDSLKSGAYKKIARAGRRLRPTRAGSGAAG